MLRWGRVVPYIPHYTIEDFLRWEGDWELWSGVPVAMSPSPRFWHQEAAGRFSHQIRDGLDREGDGCGRCLVVQEVDWHVSEDTVVCPDVSVVCGEPPVDWIKAAPALVAEFLSPSTREKDLTAKRALYAHEGVPFYVIGDVEAKELTLVRLDGDTYRESEEWNVELHPGCRVEMEPSVIFRSRA